LNGGNINGRSNNAGNNKRTGMKIALLKNGVVENIIEANWEFATELGYDQIIDADLNPVGIGWTFNGTEFINPTPTASLQQVKKEIALTKFQFISRLTMGERLAIYTAENSNPTIKMWLEMFRICQEIEPDNPDTIQGVQMLEALGFIGAGRAEQILHPGL
jgi:hypothetical protein